MPEGDTIHKLAAKLRPLLAAQRLLAVEGDLAAIDDWQLVGRRVARVEARGKNLLIHCEPLAEPGPGAKPDPRRSEELPVCLWTHMGMKGSWRVLSVEEARPRRRGHAAKIVLHTQAHAFACFAPRGLALLGPRGLLRHRALARLGPDLLDPDADLDEAIERLRRLGPEVAVGDAIMRQSAVAGIGNVYKSEILFLEGLDPFTPITELERAQLRALLERGRELMRLNLDRGGPRRTRGRGRGRYWVYERSGRPCRRCATILAMRRQGELARSTYFCPCCQGR